MRTAKNSILLQHMLYEADIQCERTFQLCIEKVFWKRIIVGNEEVSPKEIINTTHGTNLCDVHILNYYSKSITWKEYLQLYPD